MQATFDDQNQSNTVGKSLEEAAKSEVDRLRTNERLAAEGKVSLGSAARLLVADLMQPTIPGAFKREGIAVSDPSEVDSGERNQGGYGDASASNHA
jgi:hypothetical protein